MTEIEKLYELAGVEKEITRTNAGFVYPPFTAEKQIELIKWLAIKGDFDYTLDIAKNTDAYYTMYFDDTRWTCKTFEETLAGLINSMWNKLTEAERNEIREILK